MLYLVSPMICTVPTAGGYIAPPLKTRSWEDPGHPDHVVAEFRKKVGNPPADGPARGGALFSDLGDRVGWVPVIFLKNWSKKGVPPFEHFVAILGTSGPNQ